VSWRAAPVQVLDPLHHADDPHRQLRGQGQRCGEHARGCHRQDDRPQSRTIFAYLRDGLSAAARGTSPPGPLARLAAPTVVSTIPRSSSIYPHRIDCIDAARSSRASETAKRPRTRSPVDVSTSLWDTGHWCRDIHGPQFKEFPLRCPAATAPLKSRDGPSVLRAARGSDARMQGRRAER
jgi:hypothetical protein